MSAVLFFDLNGTLLDTHAMEAPIAAALGGRKQLFPLWMSTLLHCSLVETALERFTEFGQLGVAALQIVAAKNGIPLSLEQARLAVQPMRTLPLFPDVEPALADLAERGHTLVALTNSGSRACSQQLEHAGIASYFQRQLSVEEVHVYKPHRKVYEWAARQMGVGPEHAWMIAAHGWDIAGARAAGMRTVFLARAGQALYPIQGEPAIEIDRLTDLTAKLKDTANAAL